MLKHRKTGICIAVLAVIAILAVSTVCLTDRNPEELSPENTAAPAETAEKTYFWGQQEIKLEFPEENALPAMSLAGRSAVPQALESGEGSYGSSLSCVGESCFFLVRPFYTEEATRYELQVFDGDRKEWSGGYLETDLLEQGYLYHMFAVSDEELVYLIPAQNAARQYEAYYAVHMSRAGEELKRVDLLPACLELDMVQDQALPSEVCVDSQGNYYLIGMNGKQMAILDSQGQYIALRDCSIRYKRVTPWMTAGPDGGILTQGYHEENGMEWLWLDGAREKSLGSARGIGFADRIIPLENGDYYYITGDKKIYRGDGGSGSMEYLFDAGNVIGSFGKVAVNGEGEVLLLAVKKDSATAYVLTRSGQTLMGEGGQNIAVTDPLYAVNISQRPWFAGITGSLENTLPRFMAEHPEYAFDLKTVEEDQCSAVHDRVWNELIAGGGPDLFYIDREDLPALWEKGVLMDLRELISQETLDQIYPGLLETGTVDGSMAGLSCFYNVHSLMTAKDIWPEEEWTLEDVVSLLEAGEYPHAVHAGYQYSGGRALLYALACNDMANSPFIDWDAGICSFDSELFIRLLKAVKGYRSEETENSDMMVTPYQELLESNCVAVQDILCNRSDFVQIRQLMGDRYNRTGIPGADGSRQVVSAIGFIVVNKNCKNKEAVAQYLEFLLEPKNMADYRRDCRDYYQVIRDWEGKWCVYWETVDGNYAYSYPMGESGPEVRSENMPPFYVEYLECCEEYYAFMESLEGEPPMDYRRITDIIGEEAESFFESGQSAENVAEIIQRRVQLYLSEQR